MERFPRPYRGLLAVPALVLLVVGLLVISSGGVGSGSAANGNDPTTAAGSVASPARPVVEADVAGALETEGVGAAMAECAGRRVGAAATPDQLARARRQPDYAWRWAWKAASDCRRVFVSAGGPYA